MRTGRCPARPRKTAERLRAERGGGGIASTVQLTVWSRDDGILFPDLNPDPDDLYPEGSVTEGFWKNLYQGIERLKNERDL